jgi:uncharacterized membrane protein
VITFVLSLAALTYALRVAGLVLAVRAAALPERWSEVTALLPVALLAAVATTQAAPNGHPDASLTIAAVVAAAAGTRIGFLPAVVCGTLAGAAVTAAFA